jgi:hypothetical protein
MVADSETEKLQAHPLAECFPRMSDDEILSLAEDIKANGLSVPIVLYEGMILDGRNRYRACELAEIEPRFGHYSDNDPVGYVWSLNGERRSLTHEQRVAAYFSLYRSEIEKAATEIEQARRRKQGETQSGGARHANDLSRCSAPGQVSDSGNATRRTLAERLNCSEFMIRRFTALMSAPDVVKEVAYGVITLPGAEKKVGLGRKPREQSAAPEKARGARGPSTRQRPHEPRAPVDWDPNLIPGQVLHVPQPRNSPSDRLLDRVYRLVGGFPTREVGLPLAEEIAASAETFSKEMVTGLMEHLKATEKVRRELMRALDGHLKRDTSGSRNGSTE